ncbi:ATP-binding protein [Bowdeniella massiliensis]|uniref:ATP-binding protein n=1 Tax=Bowdeniella massiliensis TaxID=2932264 RepID=UPI00202837FB|nr:ATP-binding protein [Bowdeniella massiliensis]
MPRLSVEAVLEERPEQRGLELSERPEDQWFDRKSLSIAPKKLAETLTAFANAEGGIVVVGIENKKIQHRPDFTVRSNSLRQAPRHHIEPPLACEVQEVDVIDDDGEQASLLVFIVHPSAAVHYLTDGTCYRRTGDSNHKLNRKELTEFEYERGVEDYEATVIPGLTVGDLDSHTLDDFYERSGASRELAHLLKSRGLTNLDGGVTVAAALLFSTNPTQIVPGAFIRVCRFQGTLRQTGASQNITFDQRTDGPISDAIETASAWVEANLPVRKALGEDGKFQATSPVPRDAWLEAIVNAAIHRSYSLGGDHTRVEIFDDRMEITNPGKFYHSSSLDNPLNIPRYARNPRIARTCTDLGLAQELGEGIRRIFDEMEQAGRAKPMYQQKPMHITLTLPFVSRITEDQRRRLPARAEQVLHALRSLGGAGGTGDIASYAGVSNPTARSCLTKLREEGLVTWSGKSETDPRATWSISHS